MTTWVMRRVGDTSERAVTMVLKILPNPRER